MRKHLTTLYANVTSGKGQGLLGVAGALFVGLAAAKGYMYYG